MPAAQLNPEAQPFILFDVVSSSSNSLFFFTANEYDGVITILTPLLIANWNFMSPMAEMAYVAFDNSPSSIPGMVVLE